MHTTAKRLLNDAIETTKQLKVGYESAFPDLTVSERWMFNIAYCLAIQLCALTHYSLGSPNFDESVPNGCLSAKPKKQRKKNGTTKERLNDTV